MIFNSPTCLIENLPLASCNFAYWFLLSNLCQPFHPQKKINVFNHLPQPRPTTAGVQGHVRYITWWLSLQTFQPCLRHPCVVEDWRMIWEAAYLRENTYPKKWMQDDSKYLSSWKNGWIPISTSGVSKKSAKGMVFNQAQVRFPNSTLGMKAILGIWANEGPMDSRELNPSDLSLACFFKGLSDPTRAPSRTASCTDSCGWERTHEYWKLVSRKSTVRTWVVNMLLCKGYSSMLHTTMWLCV